MAPAQRRPGDGGGCGCKCEPYGSGALPARLCGDDMRSRAAPEVWYEWPLYERLGERSTPTAAEKRGLLELWPGRVGDELRCRTGEVYEPGGVFMFSIIAPLSGLLLARGSHGGEQPFKAAAWKS